jgi:hypothetical protein
VSFLLERIWHVEHLPENSIRIEQRVEPEGQNDLRGQDWIKSALKDLYKLK